MTGSGWILLIHPIKWIRYEKENMMRVEILRDSDFRVRLQTWESEWEYTCTMEYCVFALGHITTYLHWYLFTIVHICKYAQKKRKCTILHKSSVEKLNVHLLTRINCEMVHLWKRSYCELVHLCIFSTLCKFSFLCVLPFFMHICKYILVQIHSKANM